MKVKKIIFNLLVTIGFLWTTLSAIYVMVIPEHIKEMIPQFNWLTALVSGGATGLLSSSAIYLKAIIGKNKAETSEEIDKLGNVLILFNKELEELKKLLENLAQENNNVFVELNKGNVNEFNLLEEIRGFKKLVNILLQAKLTNPLIDKDIAEKIEGVLDEEQVKL